MNDGINPASVTVDYLLEQARDMTGQELLTLGLSHVAYCRSVIQNGNLVIAIHAADGTPMAIVDDEESALEAIFEHELVPALLQ